LRICSPDGTRTRRTGFISITREAAAYTGRTVKAFYEFARRAGIVRMGDGTIARRDLDRIKRQKWTAKRGRPKEKTKAVAVEPRRNPAV
jgi:hypothetical protein